MATSTASRGLRCGRALFARVTYSKLSFDYRLKSNAQPTWDILETLSRHSNVSLNSVVWVTPVCGIELETYLRQTWGGWPTHNHRYILVAQPHGMWPQYTRSVFRHRRLGGAIEYNALDHSAIRAVTEWLGTASSQWKRFRPLGHQGRPSVVRDS